MDTDDPRHGTVRGAAQHRRDGERPCDPCRISANRDRKRYRYLAAVGRLPTVDATGVVRRVRALQCLGWTLPQIASEAGIPFVSLQKLLYRGRSCQRATFHAVAKAFDRLCMTMPPERTAQERRDAAYARNLAKRKGWAPPLAWDDIDKDPAPNWGGRDTDIDPVVVMRLLQGDTVPSTRAEKEAAMAQWIEDGGSQAELCRWHGWHQGRYAPLRLLEGGAA